MIPQPYAYQRRELAEPDWRRFPGWAGVSAAEWESAQWQRAHCVKNARQLRQVTGTGLAESFYEDLGAGPARAGHDVHAGAAADAQHDGAGHGAGPSRGSPRRSTPTRCAAT